MVLIGDYSWVLYVVFSTLAALLAVYFIGLYVWSLHNRGRTERKSAGRELAEGLGGGRGALQAH